MNNNGVRDAGEAGISGVTLTLKDADGNPTGITAITDTDGHYCFTGLHPGTYTVGEIQPAGYLDGLDTPGTEGGVAQNPGDMITDIVLKPGVHAEDYNFGEFLPASISGRVHVNTNGDCADPANPPLSGRHRRSCSTPRRPGHRHDDHRRDGIITSTTWCRAPTPCARFSRPVISTAPRSSARRRHQGLGPGDGNRTFGRRHQRRRLRLLRDCRRARSPGYVFQDGPPISVDRYQRKRSTCPTIATAR